MNFVQITCAISVSCGLWAMTVAIVLQGVGIYFYGSA